MSTFALSSNVYLFEKSMKLAGVLSIFFIFNFGLGGSRPASPISKFGNDGLSTKSRAFLDAELNEVLLIKGILSFSFIIN